MPSKLHIRGIKALSVGDFSFLFGRLASESAVCNLYLKYA